MKRRTLAGALVAGAVLLAGAALFAGLGTAIVPSAAQARGWGHDREDGALGYLLHKVDPTADQRHAIADILKAHKAELVQQSTAVFQTRLAVMQAQSADQPDAKALGAAYDQAAAAAKAMAMTRLQVRQEIMGVLTADQRATLGQSRDKMLHWMQERRQDRQGAIDRWIEKLSR